MHSHTRDEAKRVAVCREDTDQPKGCPLCIERARAEKYLAAMTEMIDAESQAHNATAPVPPAVSRYLAALESIRALVEEARRG